MDLRSIGFVCNIPIKKDAAGHKLSRLEKVTGIMYLLFFLSSHNVA